MRCHIALCIGVVVSATVKCGSDPIQCVQGRALLGTINVFEHSCSPTGLLKVEDFLLLCLCRKW